MMWLLYGALAAGVIFVGVVGYSWGIGWWLTRDPEA